MSEIDRDQTKAGMKKDVATASRNVATGVSQPIFGEANHSEEGQLDLTPKVLRQYLK
jgi:hypothetical protein